MLEKIFSTALYCRAKIKLLDMRAKAQRLGIRLGLAGSDYVREPSPAKEMLAVLNERGEPIGQAPRKVVHEQGLWHLSVRVLLFDEEGRILVQKRAASKDSGRGKLAQSLGAHVPLGVSVENAIQEEMGTELGIMEPPTVSKATVFSHVSRGGTNREIAHLFTGRYKGVLRNNPFEIEWVGWFRLEGIRKLVKQSPHLFSPSFLADLKHL